MVVCEICGFQNEPGQKYCEECASELIFPEKATESSLVICPQCQHENDRADRFCGACGVSLDAKMDQIPDPSLMATEVKGMGHVKLVVEQGIKVGQQFILNDPEILIGREDKETKHYPDIDLSDQDDGYVHRHHAKIHFDNDHVMITDLGGINGTLLNNQPILPLTPMEIRIGDKIRIGKVLLRLQRV